MLNALTVFVYEINMCFSEKYNKHYIIVINMCLHLLHFYFCIDVCSKLYIKNLFVFLIW